MSLTALLPALATIVAAGLTALGGAGWTADGRLLRRAEHELDLAAKVQQRDVRLKLRKAAHDDIDEALRRRGAAKPLLAVGGAAAGATLIALLLIPWWVGRHPEQGVGVIGMVWVVLLLAYAIGAVIGWATLIVMLWTRSTPKETRTTGR